MRKTRIPREFNPFVWVVFCFLLSGCVSAAPKTFSGKADIHGLVADGKNRPVSGYKVVVDNVPAVSNETGMFTLQKIRSGEHRLFGSGPGYFGVQKKVVINNKKEILYVRVVSYDEIFDKAEELFASGDWEEAQKNIAGVIGGAYYRIDSSQHQALLFYSAISLYAQEKYKEALAALKPLPKDNGAADAFKAKLTGLLADQKKTREENK